jgi:hypothetical protein
MPDAKILRTIVTPDGDDDLVQLEIADVSLPAEDAATRLTLAVRVPAFRGPQLAYLQYQAIEVALDALRKIVNDLAAEGVKVPSGTLCPFPPLLLKCQTNPQQREHYHFLPARYRK